MPAAGGLLSAAPLRLKLPLSLARLCFHSAAARLRASTPSPLVQVNRRGPSTIPKELFPDCIAWRTRPENARNPAGAPIFALLPKTNIDRDPAVYIFPPRSGYNSSIMHSYVQVVSTPTADTPGACLLLHFDNRRYLFGRLAEGTQRLMTQRKVSLAKINDIFLTGTIDWQCTGGLFGMILSLAELKASSIADLEQIADQQLSQKAKAKREQKLATNVLNLHGGKNLTHMLATGRRFIFRKALPVRPRELRHDLLSEDGVSRPEPDYKDENIQVWSVPVFMEPTSARSAKKRKRSPSGTDDDARSQEEVDQEVREAVVKDMFGSSRWKLDTLREMRLKDVKLPAKVFVRNAKGHIEQYTGPLPDGKSGCPDIDVLVRLPWPATQVERLPETEPSKQAMSYIVKGHPRRGKFDPEAAKRLGVAKHDFKKIAAGQSVTAKDGTIVAPEMIVGPTVEGRGFAIIDIPRLEMLDKVLERPEWSDAEIMKGIDAIYWVLPESLTLEEPRLAEFVKARSSVRHIAFGAGVNPNVLTLESPAAKLIQMNHIDPDRFHLPVFDNTVPAPASSLDESLTEVARSGRVLQISPTTAFKTDAIVPLMDTTQPIQELAQSCPEVLSLAAAARTKIADPVFLGEVEKAQIDLPCPNAEIIPLGTGSAMPSKYRNVSATLVRVPGWGSYLLDCGENTLGQLRRCFGFAGADDILRDLRAVYISHAHADHHLGTVSVISRWSQVTSSTTKLAILASPKYLDFLREYQSVQSLDRLVPVSLRPQGKFFPGATCLPNFPTHLTGADIATLKLPEIKACLVDHCHEAMAVVLTFPDTGLKMGYSGDCRPSEEFAALGKGAHLLLHECTFEDELKGDAIAKKHSTMGEALEVGRKMGARRVLLTHFSQRYPKLPVIPEEKGNNNGGEGESKGEGKGRDVEVLFAFDMMRVRLGEFKQAKEFLPALRELLREGEVEEGQEGEGEGGEVVMGEE